jgi:AcrR family transcriptional regulator
MPPPATASPQRGRPRDPQRGEAILDATIELIAEIGYDRMSIEAIAARAGVSKPTLYRRWPSGKAALVADAMRARHDALDPPADTGGLRGDLLALIAEMDSRLRGEMQVACGILSCLRESAELAELVRCDLTEASRERWRIPVDRAIERGELPEGFVAPTLFADVGPSLVFMRVALLDEPVGSAFATELVDDLLLPILRDRAEAP